MRVSRGVHAARDGYPPSIMVSPKLTLTSIVATVGPASDSPEMLQKLIDAGVSVFRLNFSHGTLDDHLRRLSAIREAAKRAGLPIAVLGDLCGPKIRVGQVPEPGIELLAGQDVILDPSARVARVVNNGDVQAVLPVSLPQIARDTKPGQRVLINDGAIRMLAIESDAWDEGTLRCRVTVGGLVTTKKGINLPQTELSVPAITERDWECVRWAVQHGLDYLALSFVRKAEEVLELKAKLAELCAVGHEGDTTGEGKQIPVVSKIEKPEALTNLERIVQASDAIMVARGDLGVEMDIAQVPATQKRLIDMADAWGKPCIVATQMLESMTSSAIPTRAEASDVAAAVFDGADAVMLSAETASGKHPSLVVETMRRIIEASETYLRTLPHAPSPPRSVVQTGYRTAALAHGAWHVARDVNAKLIICWSQHGGAARYLSQTGFRIPIIAYSSSQRQTRRMALLKGVRALHMPIAPSEKLSLAAWNERVDTQLLELGWATPGDAVILVAGEPLGVQGATNTLAVHFVGNPQTGFRARG
ncbi:MAG: pyruvate kinase [Phycisphaerales bacterium]|nr:pyruvate kinase [Phycisphaerales bacterium]